MQANVLSIPEVVLIELICSVMSVAFFLKALTRRSLKQLFANL